MRWPSREGDPGVAGACRLCTPVVACDNRVTCGGGGLDLCLSENRSVRLVVAEYLESSLWELSSTSWASGWSGLSDLCKAVSVA